MLATVHRLARAYGTPPHEVMRWTADEQAFALACYQAGLEEEVHRSKGSFPVFCTGSV